MLNLGASFDAASLAVSKDSVLNRPPASMRAHNRFPSLRPSEEGIARSVFRHVGKR